MKNYSSLILILLCASCAKVAAVNNQNNLSQGALDGAVTALSSTSQTKVKVADRYYVQATLANVFGPSASAYTLNKFQAGIFGGPCDMQEQGDLSRQGKSTDCAKADVQAASNPAPNAQREAIHADTCDTIVNIDAAIYYAAALSRNLATSPQQTFPATQRPTDADIISAYDLFYPGSAPTSGVFASLQSVTATSKTNGNSALEDWRFLFLTLCSSPSWQML